MESKESKWDSPLEKRKYERRRKRYIRKVKMKAIRSNVTSFFKILLWSLYFSRKVGVVNREYIRSIKSPEKLYAYFHTFFHIDFKDATMYLCSIDHAIKRRVVTEKSFVFLMAQQLKRFHREVYVFWVGYKDQFLKPMAVLVGDDINTSIGWKFRHHAGGQFEIMRSYYKDGSAWVMVDTAGETVIMDYEYGRYDKGMPDIVVRDMNHWMKQEPTAAVMARQWNLIYNNVDIMKPSY
jgi:hypothetical protein